MPPKNKKIIAFPAEAIPSSGVEELALTNLNVSFPQGFTILRSLVETFHELEDRVVLPQHNEDDSRLLMLERTLNDETSVRMHWGVTADGISTIGKVEVDGRGGRSTLKVALSQISRQFVVEYASTVANKQLRNIPAKDTELACGLITEAHGLLVKKDNSKPLAGVTAIGGLKRRRPPKK